MPGGIFMSADGGDTWKSIFDKKQYIYDVTSDPYHPEECIAIHLTRRLTGVTIMVKPGKRSRDMIFTGDRESLLIRMIRRKYTSLHSVQAYGMGSL